MLLNWLANQKAAACPAGVKVNSSKGVKIIQLLAMHHETTAGRRRRVDDDGDDHLLFVGTYSIDPLRVSITPC